MQRTYQDRRKNQSNEDKRQLKQKKHEEHIQAKNKAKKLERFVSRAEASELQDDD